MTNQIKMVNVSKDFSERQIVTNLNFQLGSSETVLLTGKSGIGKTTLLKLIMSIDTDYEGSIFVDGHDLKGLSDTGLARLRNRTLGYVSQEMMVIGRLSALDNVLLPVYYDKNAKKNFEKKRQEAIGLLTTLNLRDEYESKAKTLSGGQQQRVMIARALINHPKFVLMDEPTSALDKENSLVVIKLIHDLAAGGSAVIVASHDPVFEKQMSNQYTLEKQTLVKL